MLTVVVVIHLFIAIAMIGLILMQKTEGNASGGGFSSSANLGNMQPRARPNALGRSTAILGVAFFATSLGLALIAKQNAAPVRSVLDAPAAAAANAPKVSDILGAEEPAPPAGGAVPAAETPAAPVVPAVPTVPNN